ncbi:Creatinine amidohydrolase, partial [Dysosmobacter welbionis]
SAQLRLLLPDRGLHGLQAVQGQQIAEYIILQLQPRNTSLELPVFRAGQKDAVLEETSQLPEKPGDGLRVKLVFLPAKVDVKGYRPVVRCVCLPVPIKGPQFIGVFRPALVHLRLVLQQVVLAIDLAGKYAGPAGMGRMGSGGPQLHAVLPDDLQDIPSGIVICLRGEHRHQLRGLRHAVVVEVVVLRQYLCGLFQSGARQRSVLVHTHGAAVGVGLPCVPTPADRQQQGVHVRPCAPVLREKFVLRDGAAVRQGEVQADPAGGGDDLHLGPGPAAIGDSHQIICRRPPRRLPERPLVLPEKFTGLRVHDLQEFR